MQNMQTMQKRVRGDEGIVDQEGDGMSSSQMGILQLNNMTYKLEPDLAIVVQRQNQTSFFSSPTYAPGQTMTCTVNSGSGFVNLRNSYLAMDVINTSTNTVASGGGAGPRGFGWFGSHGGSAANFIKRVQIIAKNGVVLERIDNANVLASAKICYQYSESWRRSVGSLMGVSSSLTPGTDINWRRDSAANGIAGDKVRFMIPLYVFSTLCDSMNSLCPAALMSGARFEFLLENANVAMLDNLSDTTVLSYSVAACRLEFETYTLTDSVMKVLNQTAATQGLEVVASTTQNTQAQRTSSQIVVDVARSCSRALNVIYKERVPASASLNIGITPPGGLQSAFFDSMAAAPIAQNSTASAPNGYTNIPIEWQVRAGQLYFPQSSIRGADQIGLAENELYEQTLRAFQKLYPGSMGQFTSAWTRLKEFRGVTTNTTGVETCGGNACYAVDLQRSSILTSGIPLSNSRQLTIQFNTIDRKLTAVPFAYDVDVYLTFQIVVRTFLSQVVLEV